MSGLNEPRFGHSPRTWLFFDSPDNSVSEPLEIFTRPCAVKDRGPGVVTKAFSAAHHSSRSALRVDLLLRIGIVRALLTALFVLEPLFVLLPVGHGDAFKRPTRD